PHSRNKPKPFSVKTIRVRPKYLVMREPFDLSNRSRDKREHVHFAFTVPSKLITDVRLHRRMFPKPSGMSGGGVWQIKIDPNTGAIGRPHLAGIIIEKWPDQSVFVATRLEYGLYLASEVQKDVDRVEPSRGGQ